jgi:hypothetical protein
MGQIKPFPNQTDRKRFSGPIMVSSTIDPARGLEMSKKATVAQRDGSEVQVKVEWGDSTHLKPAFVDQLQLVGANGQFYLVFGQTRIPVGVEKPKSIQIEPVASFIVPASAIQSIAALLQRTAERVEG